MTSEPQGADVPDRVIDALSKCQVNFILLGGIKSLFGGKERNAKDLGVLISRAPEDIQKTVAALTEAGFARLSLKPEIFPDCKWISVGAAPWCVDILSGLPQATFEQAWERREKRVYGARTVNYVALKNFPKRGGILGGGVAERPACGEERPAPTPMSSGESQLSDAGQPMVGSAWVRMRVVALTFFGILAAIAILKLAKLMAIHGDGEGSSHGNIGAIRSALSIYYGDMEGQYPSELTALTIGGKYLQSIPLAKMPKGGNYLQVILTAKTPNYHPDSSVVTYGKVSNDAGGWLYDNDPRDANYGAIIYNCTHTDAKGSAWTLY